MQRITLSRLLEDFSSIFPSVFLLIIFLPLSRNTGASLLAQLVKDLPAMQETRVQSLGQEDPLEKEMATHSSILVWRIPWTEEPCGLQSRGLQRVALDWVINPFMVIVSITTFIIFIISSLTKTPRQPPLDICIPTADSH